ncbi:MAG TPA: SpoIIE family protein phosphatase [Yinghuangia sp.]|uniref:SpoIIE family protein phosphatase n=1 Tax=Yinghuangia sp. YIM S10712 TaxID=3436930 RepID=UPI002D033320|nr:SpoIIE family protein phosphatase [Yinghuangia sp.]
MDESDGPHEFAAGRALDGDDLAVFLLDRDGVVEQCSRAATDLLCSTVADVAGRHFVDLLTVLGPRRSGSAKGSALPRTGRAQAHRRIGGDVEVAFRAIEVGKRAQTLVLAVPAEQARADRQEKAFTRALFAQRFLGVAFFDPEMRIVRTNIALGVLGGPAARRGARLADLLAPEDARLLEEQLRAVADTGVPMLRVDRILRPRDPTAAESAVSLSALQLDSGQGPPHGVAVVVADVAGELQARRRLALMHDAAVRIGGSLDVGRTAQGLVDVLVPGLGDLATVDLADAVFVGEEPPRHVGVLGGEMGGLRRAAVARAGGRYPEDMLQPGQACPRMPDIPEMRMLQRGGSLWTFDVQETSDLFGRSKLRRLLVPPDGHTVMSAPLYARGLLLGILAVWRLGQSPSFDDEDALILREIASRAALSVDNARRYTREHRAAVTLQRSLLPRASTDSSTAETAGAYLPSTTGAGVAGDWFDVIPLSSLREAFVVGDVVGRGLRASATMGRLRAAVQTLADLDPSPDELLSHLDDQVQRFASEGGRVDGDGIGATCLYAVYDPVTRRCTLASAGHPPPAVVWPDGSVEFVDIEPGPPLGVGAMPFEVTELDLPEGSVLALYTDGLVAGEGDDLGRGMARLRRRLAMAIRPGAAVQDSVARLVSGSPESPPATDDIAVLLARVRHVSPRDVVTWEFPADPAAVAAARDTATRQLAAWGLESLAFSTELVVSELVTNAIRYAGGPIALRLIRDRMLVCEVSDPSNTQPRMRRAHSTDEGGRGLFLVAQLTTRWGSRYRHTGKTIWTEQSLAPADRSPAAGHPFDDTLDLFDR